MDRWTIYGMTEHMDNFVGPDQLGNLVPNTNLPTGMMTVNFQSSEWDAVSNAYRYDISGSTTAGELTQITNSYHAQVGYQPQGIIYEAATSSNCLTTTVPYVTESVTTSSSAWEAMAIQDGVNDTDGIQEEDDDGIVDEDESDGDDSVAMGEGTEFECRPTRTYQRVREVSDSELRITLKYRSTVVESADVNICDGFRVCYDDSLQSNQNLLLFPKKQREFFTGNNETKTRNKIYNLTESVLANLESGVEFSICNREIYATRRCIAKLFCHSSQQHSGQDPVKLERNTPLKIFDYNTFEDSLREFYINQIDENGIRTLFQKPKIFLSCAQGWKPMLAKDYLFRDLGDIVQPTSLSDCLVTMEIVPLRAVDFIMALPECRDVAESVTMGLDGDYLQISK